MSKKTTTSIIEKIYNYSLEEIMGERFGRYSKYIIQDRAIPDVRDGLKPVQRRILYSMYKERNTHDKPFKKSALTVGNVIGHYHPHGDISIYDAMVRMSQDWKLRHTYIDMHGNNGSIDGDSAAAYRYTEARLSKISSELLKDLDKNTVAFAPNFDDSELEPTVLPAKFPNLLVNGTTGISAGYATSIPPHNLGEILDATIKRIDSPNCTLDTILNIVKGPDFPTGGIACGIDGIKEAFLTGKGKVVVRSRVNFEEDKKELKLVITEIPYEVNKAVLIKKIDDIRLDKKLDGILEVRDESDKDGLRVVIDLKPKSDKDLILNYLLKNTDLQTNYNYNMVAIVNNRPKQLGIIPILDAYINHFKEVIRNRTAFDLEHAKKRLHIVEGLIKALSILDEVVHTIRSSKNKGDAKDNLVEKYQFTYEQAEAIVMLQLYRLTNTDVVILEEELSNLRLVVQGLEAILADEEKLRLVMKEELRKIKKEYAKDRITDIREEVIELKIDEKDLIPKEDCVVLVTKEGYIKRTSFRSYSATEQTTYKDGDYQLLTAELNTQDTVLMFTNLGNYLFVPVHEFPDLKWKELGKHISNIIPLEEDEKIINVLPVTDFNDQKEIILVSKLGMVKKTKLFDFQVSRYLRPIKTFNLKKEDLVINAFFVEETDLIITTSNNIVWFDTNEIPTTGAKSSGVIGIKLNKGDYVNSAFVFNNAETANIIVFTDNKTAKRVKITELEKSSRARKGLVLLKEVKSNPYKVIKTLPETSKDIIGLITDEDTIYLKSTEITIMDRYSTGSQISKKIFNDVFLEKEFIKREELLEEKEVIKQEIINKPSLKEIDDRLMTIEDFLD